MKILFLNHKIEACGVYQYGLRISNILKKSDKNNYIYVEIDNHSSYLKYISIHNPDIIIYNYHSITTPYLNNPTLRFKYNNIHHIMIHYDVTQHMINNFHPNNSKKKTWVEVYFYKEQ